MYFKRVFRLFWQIFSQIVAHPQAPPSELQVGTARPPLYPRLPDVQAVLPLLISILLGSIQCGLVSSV